MSLYQIHWRNQETGKTGVGPKQFTQAEAESLALELNKDYEGFMHTAMPVGSPPPEPVRQDIVDAVAPLASESTRRFLELTESSPMPFGIHQGTPMCQIPSSYLDYIAGQRWLDQKWPAVAEYIARRRNAIDQDLERADR